MFSFDDYSDLLHNSTESTENDIAFNPPICKIQYPENYTKLIKLFNIISSKKEYSLRALNLTKEVILLNGANYTAWLYRRHIIENLDKENDILEDELKFLNELSLESGKNYQLWRHRQFITELMLKGKYEEYEKECEFLKKVFEVDAKNYHCWSFRQWFVVFILEKFKEKDLFKMVLENELRFCDELISEDFRNNSAWNHRYFVISSLKDDKEVDGLFEGEIEYIKSNIKIAVSNESVWNYLYGILRLFKKELKFVEDFCTELKNELKIKSGDETVDSRHLLQFIGEMYLENKEYEQSLSYFKRVCESDNVRRKYWSMKCTEIEETLKAGSN